MKIKKPEIVPMFKCSSGPPVESLSLWKRAELDAKLKATVKDDVVRTCAIDLMLEEPEAFIAILWLKENGRPNGAKDKVKRKPKASQTSDHPASTP